MPRLQFGFFDAGGGHRAAATALKAEIGTQKPSWEAELVNLQELLDPLDILKKYFGIRIQDFYNSMLRNGWTLGSAQLLKILQLVVRMNHRETVRLFENQWRKNEPDMLVSFVPHFNLALRESFANVLPGRPFVTILTDLADYPPHFWMERDPQYFICGSSRAVEQARSMGHCGEKVFRASGMILNPRFYDSPVEDRVSERKRLGLRPDVTTGLVLFGGHGSHVMLEIAERLEKSHVNLQLIFVCGKNEKLANDLRSRNLRFPHFVERFTTRVNHYMQLSDFFIGKPGPGSVSEAIAMRLPVIVECNAWTLPQERYNAQWVTENKLGVVLHSFREIGHAVETMIEPSALARYRANTARLENRAVFEIPAMLEQIFARSCNRKTVEATPVFANQAFPSI
jgi:Glycosyltransferase family 28 C-terminal domain